MTGVHPVESILKSPLTIFSLLVNIYGKGINSNAARHFEVHLQLFLLSSRWIHQLAISNAPTHPPCWHYPDSRRNRSPIPGIFRHFGRVVDKKPKKHLKSKNRSSRAENFWEMVSSVAKQMDAPGLIRKQQL